MSHNLLVITKEDLDGQPVVTADLETVRSGVELLHLVVGQVKVELEVGLDSRCSDGLWDDAGAALETPNEAVWTTISMMLERCSSAS